MADSFTSILSNPAKLKAEQAGLAFPDKPRNEFVAGFMKEQHNNFMAEIAHLGFATVPKAEQTPAGSNTYRACEITSACAATHGSGILDQLKNAVASVTKSQGRGQ